MRRHNFAMDYYFNASNYGNGSLKIDEHTQFYIIPVRHNSSVCGVKSIRGAAVLYVDSVQCNIRIEKLKFADLFFYLCKNCFSGGKLRGIPVIIGKGCMFEKYTGVPIIMTAYNDSTVFVSVNFDKITKIKRHFYKLLERAVSKSSRAQYISVETGFYKPFEDRVRTVRAKMRDEMSPIIHSYAVDIREPGVALVVKQISKLNIIND